MVAGRTQRFLIVAGIVGSACLCLMLGLITLYPYTPEIRTHKDAIAHVLRQRGVSYRNITFSQTWEESVNLRVFNAAVQVHMVDGRTFHGWIGCEQGDRVCFLVLRGAGINGERLPDVRDRRRTEWQYWIDRVIAWFSEQWQFLSSGIAVSVQIRAFSASDRRLSVTCISTQDRRND